MMASTPAQIENQIVLMILQENKNQLVGQVVMNGKFRDIKFQNISIF